MRKAAAFCGLADEAVERMIGEANAVLSADDSVMERTPVSVMMELLAICERHTGVADPFADIKLRSNEDARRLLPELEEHVRASEDPVALALRLSAAGNIMDVGAFDYFDVEAQLRMAEGRVLCGGGEASLKAALSKGGSLALVADNSGEVFFDILLLHTLAAAYKLSKVSLVLRDKPFLNDACIGEAVSEGIVDAAGEGIEVCALPMFLPDGSASLPAADIVICKGMANFERLSNDERPHFLFIVKCEPVAGILRKRTGQIIREGDWMLL
ncbi:MAG: DUF89 family protein [Opitutales bacterium]|nr:DUF89 family protein [Opitutales bacterium]